MGPDFILGEWAERNGVIAAKVLPNGRIAALVPLTFGRTRITVGDEFFVEHAF